MKKIAILTFGLFLFIVGSRSALFAADYYIVRNGDMLYRVPHGIHEKFLGNNSTLKKRRGPISRNTDTVKASWYGPRFHGRRMANKKKFNMFEISFAHKQLPLGTCVQVQNPKNGRIVRAPISDRGPYVSGRTLDLSCYTMSILGGIEQGVIPVKYWVVPKTKWCEPALFNFEEGQILEQAIIQCKKIVE